MSQQTVTVALTVEDVDQFPSAEECATELAHILDVRRYHLGGVVVRDVAGVRVDDVWLAGVSR